MTDEWGEDELAGARGIMWAILFSAAIWGPVILWALM